MLDRVTKAHPHLYAQPFLSSLLHLIHQASSAFVHAETSRPCSTCPADWIGCRGGHDILHASKGEKRHLSLRLAQCSSKADSFAQVQDVG